MVAHITYITFLGHASCCPISQKNMAPNSTLLLHSHLSSGWWIIPPVMTLSIYIWEQSFTFLAPDGKSWVLNCLLKLLEKGKHTFEHKCLLFTLTYEESGIKMKVLTGFSQWGVVISVTVWLLGSFGVGF